MEEKFYYVVKDGKVEEVKEILRSNPNLKINWKNDKDNDRTALVSACQNGHDSIVSILLAHPDIDANSKGSNGYTPFNSARANGKTSCVRLLLHDSRVNPNEPNNSGETPLRNGAAAGQLAFIKLWIASGREMDLGKPGDAKTVAWTDAIGKAKQLGKTEVASLLERFKSDATKTRSEVRKELRINGQYCCSFLLILFIHCEL